MADEKKIEDEKQTQDEKLSEKELDDVAGGCLLTVIQKPDDSFPGTNHSGSG